ncbi:class I SAM-dependent methyltransferase [Pseudophaeobacter sp. A-200-2]|uniref:class I SAM-dependent methyltransferase n=1 Tax=Pseudophaeobacter sp. A-200-2 TaxID=3098145 RepID=UPI0034D54550
MTDAQSISDHWGKGDVFSRLLDTMKLAGIDPHSLTVEQLSPVDHFHARGFPATVELADALPIKNGDTLIDIGSGLGGPARYLSKRFNCNVDGVDITASFVEAANKLSALIGMDEAVKCQHGDGQKLPFDDQAFDGGYTQHVTMNVPDREVFFAEAYRVLKPGAFFALTEHGLGEVGEPHHPVPWSADGSGAYLMRPADTVAALVKAGFTDVEVTDTGDKYLQGYNQAIEAAEKGKAPIFGVHILLGEQAPQIVRNAARNIAERRTHPVQIICFKPK